MEKLQELFDKLKKLYDEDPEKLLRELGAYTGGKLNYLARIGNLMILPDEIAVPEGIVNSLEERLQELISKFTSGVFVFADQEQWYEAKNFVDTSPETAHLCSFKEYLGNGSALLALEELGIEKKFSLPQALLFAEKIFDEKLINIGKEVLINLSDTVKVSGSSCMVVIKRNNNDSWELSLYLSGGQRTINPNCYILCK